MLSEFVLSRVQHFWKRKKYLKKNSIPWFHKTEQNIQFYPRIHSSGYIIVAVALRQSTHIREHISDKAMSIPTSRISMKTFLWKKIDPNTISWWSRGSCIILYASLSRKSIHDVNAKKIFQPTRCDNHFDNFRNHSICTKFII